MTKNLAMMITSPGLHKCGSSLRVVDSTDIVEELSSIADQMGTNVAFISSDFEEGNQLLNAFGGIAAI